MAIVTKRQEWLFDLDEPLTLLLGRASNYAAELAEPPTERQFSQALDAIRQARWTIREERRQARLTAEFGPRT